MQLFYNEHLNKTSKEVCFDKAESGHIIRVLRKTSGDILDITNGKGQLFKIEITSPHANHCRGKIISIQNIPPRDYHLHIAIAPTKRNERFEWFLEKSTEIGISEITPLICTHSERKQLKTKRFQRVLQSAMKQSLQTYLPQLNPLSTFSEFINKDNKAQKFIAHCEDTAKEYLINKVESAKEVIVLIGPEGDFSPEEIKAALEKKFIPVSLGETRLRTETAAIAACHTVAVSNLRQG